MKRVICSASLLLTLFAATSGCAAPGKSAVERQAGIGRIGYAIQVGAFKDVGNAERLTAKLQEQGIEAFYFRKEDGLYAVRFGDFPAKPAAQRQALRLVKAGLIGAYFIAPPRGATTIQKGQGPELRKRGETSRQARPQGDMGQIAARTAERFVGIPYRWGGDTVVEGMDCSGFVRAVFNLCGVSIPRTSAEQYRVGQNVGRESLRDGDLVFFGPGDDQVNHVGIYVGNGRFVHAPRRGDDIKVSALDEDYFARKYVGARRYF